MPETPPNETAPPTRRSSGSVRLPSARASAVLATLMLGVGVAVGAAIGPAPAPSFAGAAGLDQRLPQLAAALAGSAPAVPAQQAASTPAPSARATVPATAVAAPAATQTTPAPSTPAPAQPQAASEPSAEAKPKSKLPSITSVWFVQLAGGTLAEASAQPAADPYLSGQLLPSATVLRGWSALDASA